MADEQSRQQLAIEKLKGELKKTKNKGFADPVIAYLIRRCNEDPGFADDVLNDSKTYEKCESYVIGKARNYAGGGRTVAVPDETVYEWAEDYYREADGKQAGKKAVKKPEQKAPKAEQKSPKAEENAQKAEKNARKAEKNAQEAEKTLKKLEETLPKPEPEEQPQETGDSEKPEKEGKPAPKPKKDNPKAAPADISGQLSLFDMIGGGNG